MEQVQPVINYLDEELSKYPIMKDIERKTRVPKVYLASAVVGLGSILLMLNLGGILISNLIGFVYPAYASFEALESVGFQDDQMWLTYWIIFSFFSVIEVFSDKLISWFPFYFLIKSAFLVWCYLPQTHGAKFLYGSFVRPVLLNMQGNIKEVKSDPKKFASNVTSAAADRLNQVKASLDKPLVQSVVEPVEEPEESPDQPENPFK